MSLTHAELRQKLETDYPFYARNCLKIVAMNGRTVPFVLKPAQLRIEGVARRMEAEGRPIRIIVPKARREGVSTWAGGRQVWRCTTRENWRALIVAHNAEITGKLHMAASTMVAKLPARTYDGLLLKPPIASAERKSSINWGTKERTRRLEGDLGLNSMLTVATAGEPDAMRGDMNFDLHLSEAAHYPDAKTTLLALINTVPDEPGTCIAIESTAKGRNDFYRRCKEAERGESDYELVFLPWFEEPRYVRPFATEGARQVFIESIGLGDWGDDEPALIERMEAFGIGWDEIPERLAWRRWAIVNLAGSDLRDFQQEYPSYLDEAFLATSGQVFSAPLIAKARMVAEDASQWKAQGLLSPAETKHVRKRGRDIEVPTAALWTPRSQIAGIVGAGLWDVWESPRKADPEDPETHDGQYIVTVDPASGEELAQDGSAFSAIEVIDHRTLAQVAEYRSREDAYPIGVQALLAALHYNGAWLGVEITGGYGDSIVLWLRHDVAYPKVYYRKNPQGKKMSQAERAGWQTTQTTKGMIENRIKQLLADELPIFRSIGLCDELDTFIRDDKGRTGPEEGEFADRLMSFGIGECIAQEKPLSSGRRGTVRISTYEAA